ncbi:MAG: tRNA pseudouridine(55) synthase TruB [Clostridia bacterium]|nr:tRNA pseudouridine(55) synthase TruB [Clostridia bacterium]
MMNGIIVVNKPQEFTSFDVVALMRRLCGQRKIGHTGTLDPMAEGVLPLLFGSATKAQDILPDSDKEYRAGFRLGMTSDTLDIWGEIKTSCESVCSESEISYMLPKYRGEIFQIPPMYSAVKKDGVRLYDLARKGEEVEREPRKVVISKLELVTFDEEKQEGSFVVSCSKGTYIRTLIDDIGRDLGCGAVMTSLVRTKACGFTLEDCITIDELRVLTEEGRQPEKSEKLLRSTESLFDIYERLTLGDKQAFRFANGNAIDVNRTAIKGRAEEGTIVRVGRNDGSFIGLGIVCGEQIRIYKMFPETA